MSLIAHGAHAFGATLDAIRAQIGLDPSRLAPSLALAEATSKTPVTVRWLGTAGFEIRVGERVLLIDPYLSRASLAECFGGAIASDTRLIARVVDRADAIVVGHTHFDHALDVPAIARATSARVYGSRSAVALCRQSGIPASQLVDVEAQTGPQPFETDVDPFHIRFHPSTHAKLVFGRIPFPGEIDDCDVVPMRAEAFRCGAVFCPEIEVAGRRVVHLGSADLIEASLPPRIRGADLLLLTVAGWTKTHRFPLRMLRALAPRAILLGHWDDFFAPLDAPARALPAIGLGQLVDAIRKESPETPIGTVPIFGEITL